MPFGPIISPNPGPTFPIADAAPDKEVMKSNPKLPSRHEIIIKTFTKLEKKVSNMKLYKSLGQKLYHSCLDIVDGVIPLTVGLVSPTVTDPPRETAEPLIVIDEFASFAFAIDPTN